MRLVIILAPKFIRMFKFTIQKLIVGLQEQKCLQLDQVQLLLFMVKIFI